MDPMEFDDGAASEYQPETERFGYESSYDSLDSTPNFDVLSQFTLVAGLFEIQQRVGSGSFGIIYRGCNIETNENVAFKFETIREKKCLLEDECKALSRLQGVEGIPRLHYNGLEGPYYVAVMEFLGMNMQQLLTNYNGRFSEKTVLMLGDQLINRLEHIHNLDIIHCDLKAENVLIGNFPQDNLVYLIDFGLSKFFRNEKTLDHICERHGEFSGIVGTVRYASVNAHLGKQLSRRDDMESLGYLLLYFYHGKLPWQGLLTTGNRREDLRIVTNMKLGATATGLFKDSPPVLTKYLKYCRCLQFQEAPDYSYLRRLFRQAISQSGHVFDFRFDWLTEVQQAPNHQIEVEPCGQPPQKLRRVCTKPFHFSSQPPFQ